MTKKELLKNLSLIKEELYLHLIEESVDKYYLPTIQECEKLIKEYYEGK